MTYRVPEKTEAWQDPPGVVYVPVKKSAHDFEFTRRWFHQRNCTTFSTFLMPKYGSARPVRMLQIGVFEGMDLVWQLQQTLTHPESFVVAVDPWDATGNKRYSQQDFEAIHQRARHNLSPWGDRVQIVRARSQDYLPTLAPEQFDLVVVDGDHNEEPAYLDMVYSLRLTKRGGWMVMDDVRNDVEKAGHVRAAFERFIETHGHRFKSVWSHRYCECVEVI